MRHAQHRDDESLPMPQYTLTQHRGALYRQIMIFELHLRCDKRPRLRIVWRSIISNDQHTPDRGLSIGNKPMVHGPRRAIRRKAHGVTRISLMRARTNTATHCHDICHADCRHPNNRPRATKHLHTANSTKTTSMRTKTCANSFHQHKNKQ